MRVTRWKVMAGGLLLGAGGLMAVADGPAVPQPAPVFALPPCPSTPPPACVPPVTPAAARVPVSEPPVVVPAPKVSELPAAVPSLPPAPVPAARSTQPCPTDLPPGLVVPAPAAGPQPITITYPEPGQSKPTPPAAQLAVGFGLPALPPADAAPPPMPAAFTFAAAPAPAVPAPVAEPKKAPEPSAPRVEASATEKRLKVVLSMGDDRPRFEVRDGDEVYLKVVSDRVEVKSAADKADAATMKAAGKVGFVTPGGDGTCDELAILPGSGQVVAAGNVQFRHTWGRSETTVTAERMTFRLNHAGPTAIQAGYTPVR